MAHPGEAAEARFFMGPGQDDLRRRMATFAVLAPARVVFSGVARSSRTPVPCTPGEPIEEAESSVGEPALEAFDQPPRHAYVVVHHTGEPDTHLDTTTDYCSSGYDFFIRSDGEIVVCSRWLDPVGRHATGCNCAATGVMLTGCFGGCEDGNVPQPTEHQECSLAHVLLQIGTPDEDRRIVPHRYCAHWNPCDNPRPTRTFCCGTNLTTDDTELKWNAEGDALVARVRQKRRNLQNLQCCSPPCPQLVLAADRDTLIDRSAVLDVWEESERGYRIYLHPLAAPSAGAEYVAEVRRGADELVARRWFRLSPTGLVATDDAGLDEDFEPFISVSSSPRRWRVPLAAGVVVVSALAAVVVAQFGDSRSAEKERSAASSGEPGRSSPVRCAPPSFRPQRLPWSEHVSEPTEASSRGDGSSKVTWMGPPSGGRQRAQEVSIVRRVRGEPAEVVSATATARGHPAEITLIGDEGVGSVRAAWKESEGPCKSYELWVSYGATIEEVIALLPRS